MTNRVLSLQHLVNSLSKAERRYFQLYAGLQSGDKVYLSLFHLIDAHTSTEELYSLFCQTQDGRNYEAAVKHLYRALLDCLVRLREKQDSQTRIFNLISKANLLFERDLFDEALTELNQAKKLAKTYENAPLLLLVRRTELKFLNALNFESISEKQLVCKQMKINELLRYARTLNQHTQLYEILRHRLIHKGYSRSDRQKDDLNDLVLSELHLVANNSYHGFEAQKLHLLFQATYYLNSGHYKSAIRHYQEIIHLFKENEHLIQNPPIYYLSALQGVLDSLEVAGLYKEMPFFLEKLEEIGSGDYPSEFIIQVKASSFLYEANALIQTGSFTQAIRLKDAYEASALTKNQALSLEAQLHIYLSLAILAMYTNELGQARKYMKKIFGSGKMFHALPSYKIARLVNLLLQAELNNHDFFAHEIPSIKRSIGFEKKTYITEKMIFKFVQGYPLPSYEKTRDRLWLQYQKELSQMEQNKYERQLLKTFDALSWIEHKLTRRPLNEILAERNGIFR